ncbi:helix-turn-helix transcriptional regulator [Mycolicibacterium smegmatis]|uniref:helix-turn-helix transcriptional regulator n=1 Tax=Mycolicibacterium smegmatis TaxID=1772 RepID=UPI001EFA86C4|nr:DNA-binding protein [Mycolicibacterium smegmatis]ULN32594.1 DNA-binding protein [Mycolicibacterium smegmatis]
MSISLTENPDALLLPREVAEVRRTTENALTVERSRGTGPRYIRDGRRRILYRASDLADYLAARTVTPGSAAPQRD